MRTLYKVPTILAMEGTTSSRRTMDAETLATEGGGADQEVEGRELLRNLVAGRRRMGRVACRAGSRTRHQEDGGRAGAKLQGQMASCHLACGRGQWVWLRRRGGESCVLETRAAMEV